MKKTGGRCWEELLIFYWTKLVTFRWQSVVNVFQYNHYLRFLMTCPEVKDMPGVSFTSSCWELWRGGKYCEIFYNMIMSCIRYPDSHCSLNSDSLSVDGRMFVWDQQRAQVEEQVLVTIPIQGDVVTTEAASKTRYKIS